MLSVTLLPTLAFILQFAVDNIGKDTSRSVLEDSPPKEVDPHPKKIKFHFWKLIHLNSEMNILPVTTPIWLLKS